MGVTTAVCMILLTCPCFFFQLRVKRGESSLGLKPNNLAQRHRVNLQTSSCRLLNPTILWVRHTSLTYIHVWTWILFLFFCCLKWRWWYEAFSWSSSTGQEFVVPTSGYFCSLCSIFYLKENMAKERHCSSRRHYESLQVRSHTHRSMTHTALQAGKTSYSFVCWQKYYQKHKRRPPKPSASSSDWSEPPTEMKHSSQLLAVRRCKNVCLAKTSETLFNSLRIDSLKMYVIL